MVQFRYNSILHNVPGAGGLVSWNEGGSDHTDTLTGLFQRFGSQARAGTITLSIPAGQFNTGGECNLNGRAIDLCSIIQALASAPAPAAGAEKPQPAGQPA